MLKGIEIYRGQLVPIFVLIQECPSPIVTESLEMGMHLINHMSLERGA